MSCFFLFFSPPQQMHCSMSVSGRCPGYQAIQQLSQLFLPQVSQSYLDLINTLSQSYSQPVSCYFPSSIYITFPFQLRMELKHSQCSVTTTTTTTPLSPTTIFSKYFSQTSQIQFLEEASTGLCVGAISQGPSTLHTNKFMPPLEIREYWI